MKIFEITKVPHTSTTLMSVITVCIVILVLFFLVTMFTSYKNTKLIFTNDGIEIKSFMYGTKLSFSDIDIKNVKAVNMDDEGIYMTLRTNGIGLPNAKIGWFSYGSTKYKLYVTDKTSVVLIPVKKGYTILFSSPDAKKIVEEIKKE